VADDRDTAVSQVLAGTGTPATEVQPFPFWPRLNKYSNDIVAAFTAAPDPIYIWDASTSAGQ